MNNRERQELDRHITGNGGEDQFDGEWHKCPHCDGTGKQSGPGGMEECCHCRGIGEVWLDDADLPGDDEWTSNST